VSWSLASLPSASSRSRSASSHSPIFMWHTARPLCRGACMRHTRCNTHTLWHAHIHTEVTGTQVHTDCRNAAMLTCRSQTRVFHAAGG
jgi:hypothetical protein